MSRSGAARGAIYPHMEETAMRKLQAVLKAILLRRTKTSKIDGQPILTLPEKTEVVVLAVLNQDEQDYYTALETKTKLLFNKYLKADTIGKNYSNILVLLLRLRQAACHPHLIMDFEDAPAEATTEDMIMWAKSLAPDVVRRLVDAAVPFECPVCYDPVPNPRIVIPCGHDTCAECLVRITGNIQQEAIAEGIETVDPKCPSCRGKLDVKKIIDYQTFKQVHMERGAGVTDDKSTESDSDCDSISDFSGTENSETESSFSDQDIGDFIVPDGYSSSDEKGEDTDGYDYDRVVLVNKKDKLLPGFGSSTAGRGVDYTSAKEADNTNRNGMKAEDEDDDDDEDFVDIKDIKPTTGSLQKGKSRAKKDADRKRRRKKSKSCRKGKKTAATTPNKHTSLAQLKKEATRSAEGRRRYMRYLRKNWISSAKVDKCLEILRDTAPDVKTIVFSQFTTLLDLIEVPIREQKWGSMRYDGSMSADKRHEAVVKFTDDPRCKIMLVSLKAGNAGLNLVAASQVIIMDPFWCVTAFLVRQAMFYSSTLH